MIFYLQQATGCAEVIDNPSLPCETRDCGSLDYLEPSD